MFWRTSRFCGVVGTAAVCSAFKTAEIPPPRSEDRGNSQDSGKRTFRSFNLTAPFLNWSRTRAVADCEGGIYHLVPKRKPTFYPSKINTPNEPVGHSKGVEGQAVFYNGMPDSCPDFQYNVIARPVRSHWFDVHKHDVGEIRQISNSVYFGACVNTKGQLWLWGTVPPADIMADFKLRDRVWKKFDMAAWEKLQLSKSWRVRASVGTDNRTDIPRTIGKRTPMSPLRVELGEWSSKNPSAHFTHRAWVLAMSKVLLPERQQTFSGDEDEEAAAIDDDEEDIAPVVWSRDETSSAAHATTIADVRQEMSLDRIARQKRHVTPFSVELKGIKGKIVSVQCTESEFFVLTNEGRVYCLDGHAVLKLAKEVQNMDAAKSPKPSFTRIKLQSDNGNNEEKDSKAKKIPVAKYVPTSIPPPPQHGNDTEIRGEPLPVEAKIVSISGGATHLAAVDINGNLYTHGDNTYGQCGHPVSLRVDDLSSRVAERKHVKGLSRIHIGATTRIKAAKGDRPAFVVQVSCGSRHTVARTLQGGMIAFGDDRFIQLGVGDTRCVGKKLDLRTMAWMNRDAVYHEIDRHAMWQPKSVNPHTYFPGYLSEDVKMVESGGDFTLFALKDLTPVLNVEKARRENKIRDRAVGVPFGSSIEDYEAKMGILPVYLLAMGANDVGQCGTGVCGTSASKNLVKVGCPSGGVRSR
eukprot:GHVN01077404.1.p1 GENE.GHVN01077404.1~~GHVN01077404.1.p1  ORF type:complete len:691 (-),score=73.56 GHVN01077404.1:927-2999(-)